VISYNNNVICEPYVKEGGIRKKIQGGMATISQKTALIGLKVLRDAYITKDLSIKKGSVVYIKEEILHTTPQYSIPLICEDMKESCVIINFGHVSFVKE